MALWVGLWSGPQLFRQFSQIDSKCEKLVRDFCNPARSQPFSPIFGLPAHLAEFRPCLAFRQPPTLFHVKQVHGAAPVVASVFSPAEFLIDGNVPNPPRSRRSALPTPSVQNSSTHQLISSRQHPARQSLGSTASDSMASTPKTAWCTFHRGSPATILSTASIPRAYSRSAMEHLWARLRSLSLAMLRGRV